MRRFLLALVAGLMWLPATHWLPAADRLVFEAKGTDASSLILPENPDFGWDGTFRGQKAEAGSYRYVIAVRYIDEQVVIFSGTLQLIR
ncbi:MAG: hypothetical protein ACK5Q2_03845 [Bacteroidota bacterium]